MYLEVRVPGKCVCFFSQGQCRAPLGEQLGATRLHGCATWGTCSRTHPAAALRSTRLPAGPGGWLVPSGLATQPPPLNPCPRRTLPSVLSCLQGLAAAVERHGGKIYEGTKAWSVGEAWMWTSWPALGGRSVAWMHASWPALGRRSVRGRLAQCVRGRPLTGRV